jgi:hypothetical protein
MEHSKTPIRQPKLASRVSYLVLRRYAMTWAGKALQTRQSRMEAFRVYTLITMERRHRVSRSFALLALRLVTTVTGARQHHYRRHPITQRLVSIPANDQGTGQAPIVAYHGDELR